MIDKAAIMVDGQVHSLPRPARHNDIFNKLRLTSAERNSDVVQGFVTDAGTFLDRQAAAHHAIASGQLTRRTVAVMLFSEDLW